MGRRDDELVIIIDSDRIFSSDELKNVVAAA